MVATRGRRRAVISLSNRSRLGFVSLGVVLVLWHTARMSRHASSPIDRGRAYVRVKRFSTSPERAGDGVTMNGDDCG